MNGKGKMVVLHHVRHLYVFNRNGLIPIDIAP